MLQALGFAVGALIAWVVIALALALFVLGPVRRYKRRQREDRRPGYIDLRPRHH